MKNKNLILLTLSVAALIMPAAQAATLTLTTLTPITAGATFQVDLSLTGVFDAPFDGPLEALFGYGFNVLGGGGFATFQSYTPAVDFVDLPSTAMFSANVGGPNFAIDSPYAGTLPLAILTFLAVSEGTSSFTINTDSLNLDTGLFYSSAVGQISGSFDFTVGPGVPEPGTVGMLLLGGVCLLAMRRKR